MQYENFRQYICSWGWLEALHFWTEIAQCGTLVLLLILVIKLWRKKPES